MDVKTLHHLIATGVPACREPQLWAPAIAPALAKFGISQPAEILDFLAQTGHESSSFNRLNEDLYYTVEGLMRTWPKRFPNPKVAAEYAGQPEKLANFVYGGRYGNTRPGDGWLYRGRGIIMTTFKDNYAKAEKALGVPLVKAPHLMQDKPVAAAAAAYYWTSKDLGAVDGDTEADTKVINGGSIGLKDRTARRAQLEKAWESLQS